MVTGADLAIVDVVRAETEPGDRAEQVGFGEGNQSLRDACVNAERLGVGNPAGQRQFTGTPDADTFSIAVGNSSICAPEVRDTGGGPRQDYRLAPPRPPVRKDEEKEK